MLIVCCVRPDEKIELQVEGFNLRVGLDARLRAASGAWRRGDGAMN